MKLFLVILICCLAFASLEAYHYLDKDAEAERIVSNVIQLYQNTDFNALQKQMKYSSMIDELPKQTELKQTDKEAKAERIVSNLIQTYQNTNLNELQKRPVSPPQKKSRSILLHG